MRRLLLFTVLVVVVVALAACGGSTTPVPARVTDAPKATDAPKPTEPPKTAAGDPVAGKKVYDTACVACHGPDATGITGLGKSWVTSEFVKSQTDAQLLDFIKKGRLASDPANTTGVDMPAKGGNPALNDADLNNIIAYMRSINK